MAKLTKLPGAAIIGGFKGTLDFYVWKGIVCVRRWPRSPGHRRAPAVMARWPAFTTANRLWTQLSPEIIEAYKRMAAGLHLTGRDIFIKSYITPLWLRME